MAQGQDPDTGEPFGGDVERIFQVFLSRNVPLSNETMITYVDGEPYRRSADVPPVRLDRINALNDRWHDVTESQRGSITLEHAGRTEYLAVPLAVEGDAEGVFVIARFRDLELADYNDGVMAAVGVGIVVLIIASFIAWNVSGQVLRPVRRLTSTARQITDTDFSGRIPVRGADEVSQLAHTFNQMLDRLEDAFVSQRSFIDDAGHELRTPITIIRGHLELLDHTDPADRQETVDLVMDELDRMHRMVEDLLLLAKSEQPTFLSVAPVETGALMERIYAKAQALADRDWQLEHVAAGITVVADSQRLTQAMVQIAQNAVQHTVDSDRITLGSGVSDGRLRLWVTDTGPGVSPADAERIFGRFARGSAPGQRGEGAGLGLAIVEAIADAHHGQVMVDSVEGKGATFTVELPLGAPGEPTIEIAAPGETKGGVHQE